MMKRTHLAIGLAFALLFLPHVNDKISFFLIAVSSSLIPDIDSPTSYLGRHKIFRPLQWLSRHRGIFHSFTICVALSIVFSFYIPVLALPFFLGYSSHLVADSFTLEGITPFWPWAKTSEGVIRTGSRLEKPVFIAFLIVDAIFFLRLFV